MTFFSITVVTNPDEIAPFQSGKKKNIVFETLALAK
jgi:hypothetical protein